MTKLELIHSERWLFSLYKDDNENLIFSVLCGSVGLYETNLILNNEEIKEYKIRKNEFLRNFSDSIISKPTAYRDRHIRIDDKLMVEAHKKDDGQ